MHQGKLSCVLGQVIVALFLAFRDKLIVYQLWSLSCFLKFLSAPHFWLPLSFSYFPIHILFNFSALGLSFLFLHDEPRYKVMDTCVCVTSLLIVFFLSSSSLLPFSPSLILHLHSSSLLSTLKLFFYSICMLIHEATAFPFFFLLHRKGHHCFIYWEQCRKLHNSIDWANNCILWLCTLT